MTTMTIEGVRYRPRWKWSKEYAKHFRSTYGAPAKSSALESAQKRMEKRAEAYARWLAMRDGISLVAPEGEEITVQFEWRYVREWSALVSPGNRWWARPRIDGRSTMPGDRAPRSKWAHQHKVEKRIRAVCFHVVDGYHYEGGYGNVYGHGRRVPKVGELVARIEIPHWDTLSDETLGLIAGW